jgi:hypothetical protein
MDPSLIVNIEAEVYRFSGFSIQDTPLHVSETEPTLKIERW